MHRLPDKSCCCRLYLNTEQTTPTLASQMWQQCWHWCWQLVWMQEEEEEVGAHSSTWRGAYAVLAHWCPCSRLPRPLSIQFPTPLHSYMPQHPRTWPYAIGLGCWSTLLQPRMTAHNTHTHTHTQSFRQMGEKVYHVMCEVNRGQGGVSNYGETDCKERQTCVSLHVCANVCL